MIVPVGYLKSPRTSWRSAWRYICPGKAEGVGVGAEVAADEAPGHAAGEVKLLPARSVAGSTVRMATGLHIRRNRLRRR